MSVKEKVVKTGEHKEEIVTSSVKKPEKVASHTPAVPLPISFSKWFKLRAKERGFKPHWVAGMQAFTNTAVPRTVSDWDRLFENY